MRRLTAVAVSLVVLLVLAVVADRAAAAVLGRVVDDRLAAAFPGVGSTSTTVEGIPVLTQVARGSLDHVVVSLDHVPTSGGLVLDHVDADLYDVSTRAPRTAARVEAGATVSLAALQARIGDRYVVSAEGDTLVATVADGVPVAARLRPVVTDGRLSLELVSVSVLGVEVDASRLPSSFADRVTALAGSIGRLPLGLVATSASVTPAGVVVTATGTDVPLEGA
ncbi:MAG: DUF2993 domain-containing protein [Frankiales bacterium]|nr:DUF2993 domain-containing protein [Frankiales bacterium]